MTIRKRGNGNLLVFLAPLGEKWEFFQHRFFFLFYLVISLIRRYDLADLNRL